MIVDHLSEMSAATRNEIRPDDPDFPINALVVTSRTEEPIEPTTTIKPLRIQGNRLASFMEAYLRQLGKRDLFEDTEYFDACRQLSIMVGKRDITVLLAKLYADQLIAAKETASQENLPDNIPDLMLSYLNELNRGATKDQPSDRTVQDDAKVIAWECLKRTYHPTTAKRSDVIVNLGGENPESRLEYLEHQLYLIQTLEPSQDEIRFTLDPVAEYLAGLKLVELYGNDEDFWHDFLSTADSMPGAPQTIKGFLLAVQDCYKAKGTNPNVLYFLQEEISKRMPQQDSQTTDTGGALTPTAYTE